MPKCDGCGTETNSTIMSMFNTDILCPDCKDKERKHPDYTKACEAELAAVQSGNRAFPGIGKPKDL